MNKAIIFIFCIVLTSCNTKTEDTTSQDIAASTIESNGITVTTVSIKQETFQKQIVANGRGFTKKCGSFNSTLEIILIQNVKF